MKHIIVDCDTGIDDSIAILYALKSNKLHVEGFTTVYGNTSSMQAAENTLRLIKLAKCGYDIPVLVGANESMTGDAEPYPVHIHGDNGIGNVELPESEQKPLNEDAADFIIKKAEELKGDLTIVALGRLTNIAAALEKDPRLPYKIKHMVVMGGAFHKPGNISPYAEANIYGDAKASDIVFRAGFPMTVVGLDVTMETFLSARDITLLCKYCREENREVVQYIQSALEYYFQFSYESMGCLDNSVVHDPLAMVIAEDPSIGEYRMVRAAVEYENKEFRGMIKRDEGFIPVYDHDEILYCIRVNSDLAVRRLLSVF
ncbi:nucleoside hydrolase [Lacrimispora saccharolytica]|uniref:Inosine/uridine-preferring nucleoside hydrolase n=1 Tax=Lacrimispora saccharolytica (strain ATCC 35040 / DSM 2544 / NRCC 2533 / WM1) TaxID=610130 RepID=D9R416_LACSW|nr:nucleoside hydrolase [Lacrimispora saccharolytica]ADL03129.1 Inosine/uridine-preferring nucleoside hydrolase [[Clostridium] saccharolyticum WM1]QRV18696.1 nucleoside hydrolase [Lacrimispora saccharolytica]